MKIQKYLKDNVLKAQWGTKFKNTLFNISNTLGLGDKSDWKRTYSDLLNLGLIPDNSNGNVLMGVVNPAISRSPTQLQASKELMSTINKFWLNLKKVKTRVLGTKTSGILTKPGTAPTTFNGQNINYITSPKGGGVTHKFYTEQGSEYILTKDGFARRVKAPHNSTGGTDSGLHDWNEGTTIFTKGEDGKLFNTAFYKLNDFGFKNGTFGLVKLNGKVKMMLIDPKTNKWRDAMFSDAYPTTIKLGLRPDKVLEAEYSDIPFIGGNVLEKTSGSWHPGSPVVFIEGMKKGGSIYIKPSKRGSFTRWCGGKVTNECILKGKNSSNPAIRKKATFAQNVRKFKH